MSNQPDILFIFCDQWNARYLGCAGHPQVRTPNLDALATEGCVFDTCYTPSPVCMPARVSLASGLYPHSHGFWMNYTGTCFPAEQVTLFRGLQDAGYTTAKIGKYHFHSMEWGEDYEDYRDYYDQLGLDWAEETSTPFQGPFLDTAYSRLLKENGLLEAFITDIGDRYVDGQYVARPSSLPPDMTPDGYVCRQALAYLERTPVDKPLFLCASFPGPHTPLDAPGQYADMYDPKDVVLPENYDATRDPYGRKETAAMIAQYMGKITHLDDRIGQLIEAVKRRGNWENTVVVFSADHGDRMGEHGLVSKCGFEEGSARVPLIIGGPGAPTTGSRNASPVSLLDLFPTFLELAGGEIPYSCQAESLLPLVRGECEEIHDAVFSEIANGDSFNYMVRDARWKWYCHGKSGRQCLFDMAADPLELHNCLGSPEYADTLRRLRERLLAFLMENQINHARGYRILFDRMGMRFPTEDPNERKSIIRERLREVHR
jgi:choline-sulfatase